MGFPKPSIPFDECPVIWTSFSSNGDYIESRGAAGLKSFGLLPGERVGQNVFEVWSHRPDILIHTKRALSGHQISCTLELNGKSYFHAFFPIKNERGKVERVDALILDVSGSTHDDTSPLLRERKLRLQNETLVRLAKSELLEKLNFIESAQLIAEVGSRLLGVDSAGVWTFNEGSTELLNITLYEKGTKTFSSTHPIPVDSNPTYFKAIEEERVLAISDVFNDVRTAGFQSNYLESQEVGGMLDVPIRIGDRVVGIICYEVKERGRIWSIDDKNFAASTADLLSIAIERYARQESAQKLKNRLTLEQVLTRLAASFLDLEPHAIEPGILQGLRAIADACRADRAYFIPHRRFSDSVYEWSSSSLESIKEQYKTFRSEILGQLPLGMSSPQMFKDLRHIEAPLQPTRLFPPDCMAATHIPLAEGGKLLGVIGLHKKEPSPLWEDEIFSLLHIAGETFVNALRRKKLDDEARLHLAILDLVQDAVMVTDLEGRILFWNKGATSTYGFSRDEMIGKIFCETLGGFNAQAKDILSQKGVWSEELEHPTAFGNTITVAARFRVIREHDELPSSILIITTDITQQKILLEQKQRTEKLETVGLLAGGIAHDFNNILTVIQSSMSLAKISPSPNEHLETAEKALKRAQDITQQFLTFSKGGVPVKKKTLISDVIRETTTFSLHGCASKLILNIPEGLPSVEIDEGQISQAIQNLVINADQSMPEGGTVTVTASEISLPHILYQNFATLPPGKYVLVTVQDTGKGICEENKTKIFDPYFTTKPSGSGLGLSSVISIVRKHFGDIYFESKEGVGTTFCFVVPAAEKDKNSYDPQTLKLPLKKNPLNILIIDDEEMIVNTLKELLEHLGHTVFSATSSHEAFDILSDNNSISLAIMDLTLPGDISGIKLLEKIKKISPKISVVVSSGYSNAPIMSQHKEFGFSGILKKPYTLDELKEMIEMSC